MNTILSENLKKLRIAKRLTQEQVAGSLNVNAQTVSRWECGTTLPDALTLPILAQLYGVTVNDFYKKNSIAYDNYAQRLSSVYEKTSDPSDFLCCILEFQKLMKECGLTLKDEWHLATVYHQMLCDCKEKALFWYEKAISDSKQEDSNIYRLASSHCMKLLLQTKGAEEVIGQLKEACECYSADPQAWDLLLQAYIFTQKYKEGYAAFLRASRNCPESWPIYIHGGEICQELKKYDEAFLCWEKAAEIGTYFHDEMYCKAYCLESMEEYEKAAQTLFELADILRREHYDVEADMAEENARMIRNKM